jgi:hypothetical protein
MIQLESNKMVDMQLSNNKPVDRGVKWLWKKFLWTMAAACLKCMEVFVTVAFIKTNKTKFKTK